MTLVFFEIACGLIQRFDKSAFVKKYLGKYMKYPIKNKYKFTGIFISMISIPRQNDIIVRFLPQMALVDFSKR